MSATHREVGFLERIISGKIERAVAQCSIALLALASIAIVCDRLHLNVATVALLFIIVIVLLARVGDFLGGIGDSAL